MANVRKATKATKGAPTIGAILALLGSFYVAPAGATQEVWLGDTLAVTYSARVEQDWLVLEAVHEPEWHTYALDNPQRAKARAGKPDAESEMPTRLAVSPGVKLAGPWRQPAPKDLSQPDIRWYTWGFEAQSYFAAPIATEAPLPSDAWVRVDAQACTDKLCAMVDGLRVPVEESAARTVRPQDLTPFVHQADPMARSLAALHEFGDRFQRSLDLACTGEVHVGKVAEVIGYNASRPRQMNWVMGMDVNADGTVEPWEIGVGMQKNIEHQTERRMQGDVDGDHALSQAEYALFIPDPGGELNDAGVSTRAAGRFATLDTNRDDRVQPVEIINEFATSYQSRYWARLVLFHLARADRDSDGRIDAAELSAAGASGAQSWLQEISGKTDAEDGIALAALVRPMMTAGTTPEDRARLEAPIASLMTPACRS